MKDGMISDKQLSAGCAVSDRIGLIVEIDSACQMLIAMIQGNCADGSTVSMHALTTAIGGISNETAKRKLRTLIRYGIIDAYRERNQWIVTGVGSDVKFHKLRRISK